MKIEEKFVETSFGRLAYLEFGKGKKTAVFVHGWLGHPAPAILIASYLVPSGYRVLAPYLPGHGSSFSINREFSFSDLKQTLLEFYKNLGIKNSYTIGHSVGGALVWEVAAGHDGKIKKAVVVDGFSNPRHRGPVRLFVSWVKDRASGQVLKEILGLRHWHSPVKVQIKPFQKSALLAWNVLRDLRLTTVNDMSTVDNLLLLWGKEDKMAPLLDWTSSTGISSERVVTYSGGHYWFILHLDELKKRIEEFFK